tara:strand:+ start:1749 stop:1901 length:153 start_codon:yes stop_codon:yes gene_type:complete
MKIGDLVKWNMVDSYFNTIGIIVAIRHPYYTILWADGSVNANPSHQLEAI